MENWNLMSDVRKEHGIYWLKGRRAGMKIVFPPIESFSVIIGSEDMISFGVELIIEKKDVAII